MKPQTTSKKWFVEIAGWYGALAIVAAYTLVTFNIVDAQGIIFQLLNLTGALGILIISIYKRVKQSIVLNIFWSSVALIAIIRIIVGFV